MNQLTSGHRYMRPVRAEFDGIDGVFERNAVKHHTLPEVDELASVILVDGEEKHAVRRGGDSGDVGGRLDG